MSKQTFRKNINSRTTKMKAVLAAGKGAQTSAVVSLSSSQPVRKGPLFNFSKYDEIDIHPRDFQLQIRMLGSYQKVTKIGISERVGQIYTGFQNFDFSFNVTNPMKMLMGDGTSYYSYTLEAGVKKIIEQIDSGLIELYKDYSRDDLENIWIRRNNSTEYAYLLASAFTFYAGDDTVIFTKSN